MTVMTGRHIASRMSNIGTETAFEVCARARALEAEGRHHPSPDRRAGLRHARQHPRRRRSVRSTPARPTTRRTPGSRSCARRSPTTRGAQGIPGRPVAGLRHRRRQGRDALRDPRPRGSGRRGPRPGPRLPDLRVADPVRRRARRCRSRSGWSTTSASTSTSSRRSSRRAPGCSSSTRPANPTGGVLTRADLEAIAELAIEHDLWCSPTRSTAGSCTTARSTSRSRRCRAWRSGRSSSTGSPRPSR